MKHDEQELWQRARQSIRRAKRHVNKAWREYERIEEIRRELEKLTKPDEDIEF